MSGETDEFYKHKWEGQIEKRFDRFDAEQFRQRNTLVQLEKGQQQLGDELHAVREHTVSIKESLEKLSSTALPADLSKDLQRNWHDTKMYASKTKIIINAVLAGVGSAMVAALIWAAKQGAI